MFCLQMKTDQRESEILCICPEYDITQCLFFFHVVVNKPCFVRTFVEFLLHTDSRFSKSTNFYCKFIAQT